MDPEAIGDLLDALSDPEQARRTRQHIRPIRGVRGVASGEISRIAVAIWEEEDTALPQAGPALGVLFSSAFEDGLVALSLLAAKTPTQPVEALHVALDWMDRVDDLTTADSLGWGVIGPVLLQRPDLMPEVFDYAHHSSPYSRRAALMSAMAGLPEPVEGAVAACLREMLGHRAVRFVDEPDPQWISTFLTLFLRDEAPPVRKALRRVCATWAFYSPDNAMEWANTTPGGIPKMVRREMEKKCTKGNKRRAQAAKP